MASPKTIPVRIPPRQDRTERDADAIHDVWTLGLRSRRALSFQTREKNIREILKTNFRKY